MLEGNELSESIGGEQLLYGLDSPPLSSGKSSRTGEKLCLAEQLLQKLELPSPPAPLLGPAPFSDQAGGEHTALPAARGWTHLSDISLDTF